MPRVLVGMSGGVDSSIAAYLLKERGFDVRGVSFLLWDAKHRTNPSACCSLEATTSASETAESIGIPHASVDVRGEFIEKVIDPFVDAYENGLTPNPCILCNRFIKFPFLLREAERTGAEYLATGHYAKVGLSGPGLCGPDSDDEFGTGEKMVLRKGIDPRKDQSYVLYPLDQTILGKMVLPLGEYRKEAVREIARSLRLAAAERPESQEICFIEDRNYFKFIEHLSPLAGKPGPIMNTSGKVLGLHQGIYRYTLGQRKGLGISSPVPLYVARIDTANNAVIVGSPEDAKIRDISVRDVNWILPPLSRSFRATVKVRSMMEDTPASLELHDDWVRVAFDEPQWAPAPGQSAVFYRGDCVLGGGIISGTFTA